MAGSSVPPSLPPEIFLRQHFGVACWRNGALLLVNPCVHAQQCPARQCLVYCRVAQEHTWGLFFLELAKKNPKGNPGFYVIAFEILQRVPERATH